MLGWKGFLDNPNIGGSHLEAVYRSLQLFVMESGTAVNGLNLQIARFLSLAVSVYAVVLTLLHLFYERMWMFQSRLWKDHVIVCGLGSTGFQLVKELSAKRSEYKRIVVIERNEMDDNIKIAEDLGAVVLCGDATDVHMLKICGAQRARRLICRVQGRRR